MVRGESFAVDGRWDADADRAPVFAGVVGGAVGFRVAVHAAGGVVDRRQAEAPVADETAHTVAVHHALVAVRAIQIAVSARTEGLCRASGQGREGGEQNEEAGE